MKYSVFRTFLLGTMLIFLSCECSFAQGPNSPEVAGFEPVDSRDMVSLVTGDLSYVLPLINIPGPEGGYPLALSYHSGIAMEQEASWVGLGWSLTPGSINRQISGTPDDWKNGLNSLVNFDIGGVSSQSSLFIGVAFQDNSSVGIMAAWSSNKTFGGENTYNYSISGSYTDTSQNSYSLGVSNKGDVAVGYGGQYGNISYNSSNGFAYGNSVGYAGISANLSLSQESGLGISLNTAVGSNFTIVGDKGFSKPSIGAVSYDQNSFMIMMNFYGITVKFTNQRIRYWQFDEKTYYGTGSLYAGELDNILSAEKLPYMHKFDASESTYKNSVQELAENNPTYMSYDQYSLTGQGIVGSISPYIFDSGFLHQDYSSFRDIDVSSSNQSFELRGLYYYREPDLFDKSLDNIIKNEKPYFYFDGEYSSYYLMNAVNNSWDYPSSFSSIDNFKNNVDFLINSENDGFNPSEGRLKKSSYVESFTNESIIANPLLILDDPINRNNLEQKGIGAFKITVADGKVYHYALPVYQHEKFDRYGKLEDDINIRFVENQSLSSFATHWLLTAITGPDYIDINNNNKIDKDDYGYWVKFDYGKWSDGYGWKTPAEGYNETIESKGYSWGVKQIYYLDRITTRTHSALFIKEPRNDNQTNINIVGGGRNNLLEREAVYYSYINGTPMYVGTDGLVYYPGAYSLFSPGSLPNPNNGSATVVVHNGFYARSFEHTTLRLKEIILLKNEDLPPNLSTTNGSDPQDKLTSDFYFTERVEMEISNGGGYYDSGTFSYVDKPHRGEFHSNILDATDISILAPNIKNKALKIIKFDYDYSLAYNTPNSAANNQGKLALKGVNFIGKNNIQLIPPYLFKYHRPHVSYNRDVIDEWGYHKNNPETWSLSEVQTPIGASLFFDYESDVYNEMAVVGRIFNNNLQIKFTGSDSGSKQLFIQNDPENTFDEDVDFLNYFDVGDYAFVDVQFWNNPNGSTHHKQADVAKKCIVLSVTATQVIFELPINNQNGDVRRDSGTCKKEDWVFYRRFYDNGDGVVEYGWQSKRDENNCDDPGDDNWKVRYKIISERTQKDQNGGGLRVKKISIKDIGGESHSTSYSYNNPSTGLNSGVTSFAPSRFPKEIPYMNYLPSPNVLYEYVNVIKDNAESDLYRFKTLDKFVMSNNEYNLGDILKIKSLENASQTIPGAGGLSGKNIAINTENFLIEDYISSLGRLVSKERYNSEEQIMEKIDNSYLSKPEMTYGTIKESFNTLERLYGNDGTGSSFTLGVNLGNTSLIKYSNVLNSVFVNRNGYNTLSEFKYNYQTGQTFETISKDSYGNKIKSQLVPAYTIPNYSGNAGGYGMGSKVDDITNKNMLSQLAANYTFIEIGADWKPIGVGITTWNKEWWYRNLGGLETTPSDPLEKIWRKHQTYKWDGEINEDGIYIDYNVSNDDGFVWGVGTQPTPWKMISQIERYNHYSKQLEISDINNNFASIKMGDHDTKVISTSNAMYTEMYYSGAEYYYNLGDEYFDGEVSGAHRSEERSHTGRYSVKLSSGQLGFAVEMKGEGPRGIEHRPGKYLLSVWANKENYQNARIKLNGATVQFNGESTIAGNWVQMNHYFDISNSTNDMEISVTSASGIIYFDDFRILPVASGMNSYVYNEFDELTFILGTNNLGTKYQYDEAGRLVRIYVETVDSPTILGGFKLAKEYRYNYKGETGNGGGGGDCDFEIEFYNEDTNNTNQPSTAKFNIGSTGGKLKIDCRAIREASHDFHIIGYFIIRDPNNNVILDETINLGAGGNAIPEDNVIVEIDLLVLGEYSASIDLFNHFNNDGTATMNLISVIPTSNCLGENKSFADRDEEGND